MYLFEDLWFIFRFVDLRYCVVCRFTLKTLKFAWLGRWYIYLAFVDEFVYRSLCGFELCQSQTIEHIFPN